MELQRVSCEVRNEFVCFGRTSYFTEKNIKLGHESLVTQDQESPCWRGPATVYQYSAYAEKPTHPLIVDDAPCLGDIKNLGHRFGRVLMLRMTAATAISKLDRPITVHQGLVK
jgi:hypothetical protein